MRSKIRWFTEFCNSHYVSHFAAFFIVARAKISVVESYLCLDALARPDTHMVSIDKVWFGVGVDMGGQPTRFSADPDRLGVFEAAQPVCTRSGSKASSSGPNKSGSRCWY